MTFGGAGAGLDCIFLSGVEHLTGSSIGDVAGLAWLPGRSDLFGYNIFVRKISKLENIGAVYDTISIMAESPSAAIYLGIYLGTPAICMSRDKKPSEVSQQQCPLCVETVCLPTLLLAGSAPGTARQVDTYTGILCS